jgi:hypothetical protein
MVSGKWNWLREDTESQYAFMFGASGIGYWAVFYSVPWIIAASPRGLGSNKKPALRSKMTSPWPI